MKLRSEQRYGWSLRHSGVATIAVLAVSIASISPSWAIDTSSPYHDMPSQWAPTGAISQVTNDARPWGKVAYFFNWTGIQSMNGWSAPARSPSGDSVIELGFKQIDHTGLACTDSPLTGKSGFPPEVNVQVDYTEDPEDAVIWIADLDILRADQRADLSKVYGAWMGCGGVGDDGFFSGQGQAEFEVQVGHYDQVESPSTTYSNATLHHMPRELSEAFLPEANDCARFPDFRCRDPRLVQAHMIAPWIADPSFEAFNGQWLTSADVTAPYICDSPTFPSLSGRCHVFVKHNSPGAAGSILYQDFQVQTTVARENFSLDGTYGPGTRLTTGNNTAFQVEAKFRCPVDSPQYKGSQGDVCQVGVFLGTSTNGGVSAPWYLDIPADGKWYYAAREYGAQAASTDVRININSYGYPLDIDELWVSGGL